MRTKRWYDRKPFRTACGPGRSWLRQFKTLEAAWAVCDRADWMRWYLFNIGCNGHVLTILSRGLGRQNFLDLRSEQIRSIFPTPPESFKL